MAETPERETEIVRDDELRMDKDDVIVDDLPVDECDECTVGPTTKVVMLDLRAAGMQVLVGRYCAVCANAIAARIRGGLPR